MLRPEAGTTGSWRWLTWVSGALFAALALHGAMIDTPTVDEAAHLPAGAAYLEYGAYELYLKNPPLFKQAMALPAWLAGAIVPPVEVPPGGWGPWAYAVQFQRQNPEGYLAWFFLGRCVVIACTLLCGLLLHRFAQELAGKGPAAICTALFFLNPTVIAHGHLATIDLATATSVLGTVMALRWAYRGDRSRATPARVAAAGAVWGVALLVKFTALLLAPGLVLLVIWERRRAPFQAATDLLAAGTCALLVVNAGMGGGGALTPLGELPLDSETARAVQRTLPGGLPILLPRTYAIGLDAQAVDAERGEFGSYLLGEWSADGWWYYNLVAIAVKTPIPTLLAVLAAPLAWRRRKSWLGLVYVFAPLVALAPVLLFGNSLNIGVRYALPLLPFALLATTPLWRELLGREGLLRLLPTAAIALQLASTLWAHPAHLAWFNAFAGGSSKGHLTLADSNLDWGQDLHRLPAALEELDFHGRPGLLYFGSVDPRLYGIEFRAVPPRPPKRGVVAVSANFALGAEYLAPLPNGTREWIDRAHTEWLRNRTPTLKAGSLWLYDLRPSGR